MKARMDGSRCDRDNMQTQTQVRVFLDFVCVCVYLCMCVYWDIGPIILLI
jgi:hypothetical protein